MYREAPIVSDPTTEEKPMSNQNTLTRDEREQWASSRECCDFIADALGWDDESFESGEKVIWLDAAKNARAAGIGDGQTLHWGAQSRTVIEVFDASYRESSLDAARAAAAAARAACDAAVSARAAAAAAYDAAAADAAASRAAAAAMSDAATTARAAADAANVAYLAACHITTQEPK